MPRPRKRFGQHFLVDPGAIDAIVGAIAPAATDVLVEIGPGRGAITTPLARLAGELHLVELDRDLVRTLRERYSGVPQVTVHEADALRFDFASLGDRLRLVGNLPYNISTPLLFHLLEFRDSVLDMHFMLQREVVDRLAATPGSRDFGRLTVMIGVSLAVARLFDVPPDAFEPPPAVMSALVRLAPLPAGSIEAHDRAVLAGLVQKAFGQRRKTLRNALRGHADEHELAAAGIDPGLRAEQVPIERWVALANVHAGR